MGNLFFPQLMSGALAQYPIRKALEMRTVKNALSDGNMFLYSDPNGCRMIWHLEYAELSDADLQMLEAHFANCQGTFRAFTFIDPTENMLVSSSNLLNSPWQRLSALQIVSGVPDPVGGTGAFSLTNTSQATEQLQQTLVVPAGYQYCLSAYVRSSYATNLLLSRAGASVSDTRTYAVGQNWIRISSSGRISDSGTTFTVGIGIHPGQTVEIYGVQLEAQIAPSRFRPTTTRGGVYANAHFAVDEFPVIAEAPGLFSTALIIEATV
ncbi:MAG: hypothetical protein JOZ62_22420 [Acidobacteriaceae bacterium]|nr:hypothetical protein [Acidobacteriaceae bacterium]